MPSFFGFSQETASLAHWMVAPDRRVPLAPPRLLLALLVLVGLSTVSSARPTPVRPERSAADVVVRENVRVPMRDSTTLPTDVYLPTEDGRALDGPFPTLLTRRPPTDAEPTDTYRYDPQDPVPSVGGYNSHSDGGVADRAKVYRGRDDILVYQTERLAQDVAVVGPITVTLYAATSARDTDFVVNLTDVNPGASAGALWVAEGARRGRIGSVEADPRAPSTYAEVQMLEPGEIYEWKIAVWPTARVFEEGHRIRIEISSSNFPRYNRNLNTGAGLAGTESIVAHQTIYHDIEHPSHVEVPLVPMDVLREHIIDGPPQ